MCSACTAVIACLDEMLEWLQELDHRDTSKSVDVCGRWTGDGLGQIISILTLLKPETLPLIG